MIFGPAAARLVRMRSEGAAPPAGGRPLGAGPWWVRQARGPDGRPALELYQDGELLDVMVDSPVAPALLRGARRAGRGRRVWVIAWGRRAAGGSAAGRTAGGTAAGGSAAGGAAAGAGPRVEFGRGRLRRRSCPAALGGSPGWCWIAVGEGTFRRVSVTDGESTERSPLRPARPW